MSRADRRTIEHERVRVWAAFAFLLAAAGLAGSLWRPYAPSPTPVATDLDVFDPAVLAAVAGYRDPRIPLVVVATVIPVVVPLLVVTTAHGRRAVAALAGDGTAPARRGGLIALAITLVTSLVGLPLAAWSRLVHDARWEFRTQTAMAWFGDWAIVATARALLVASAVGVAIVAARRWPRSWPYRLSVAATAAAAVGVMLHPVLLLPVILPMEPLGPEAPSRATIDPVLEAAGEPDLPVFVAEESRRSTRVNALATGLGPSARVVIYDNLLELPGDQVASVVAHEVAHHQHRDLSRGVLLVATASLPALVLLRRLVGTDAIRRRVDARGVNDPRIVGVVLLLVAGLHLAAQPAINLVSRNLEAAADARTLAITGDPSTLIASTRIYTVRDLADPDPSTWVHLLYRTHPSVGARIRQAVAIAARDELVLPSRVAVEGREAAQRHPAIGKVPS